MPCVRSGLLTEFEIAIGTFILFFPYTVGIRDEKDSWWTGSKQLSLHILDRQIIFRAVFIAKDCTRVHTHAHTCTHTYTNKQTQWATSTLKL